MIREAGTRRAIDIRAGEKLDPDACKGLIKAAIEQSVQSNPWRSGGR